MAVTLAGVAFSAASAGLGALGEARLHAIAEEDDARGRAAQDVLARLPQLRARLVVGRFTSIVAMSVLALVAAEDTSSAITWLIPTAVVYGLLADLTSSVVRRRAARVALPLIRLMRPLELLMSPIALPMVALRSLTERWDGKLIAVIVSGFDGDGAEALRGIKEVGGTTIAQKLDTATQPDMPESAIASGCVDFILSPEEIALKIVEITAAESRTPRNRSGRVMQDQNAVPSDLR